MKKTGLIFTIILLISLMIGCTSTLEELEDDFEQYGYYLVLSTNEDFEDNDIVETYMSHVYEVYDEQDTFLAYIFQFKSMRKLESAYENGDIEPDKYPTRENLLLLPQVPDPDIARLVLVFYGHDPEAVLEADR